MIAIMEITMIAFACLQVLIIAPSVVVFYPDVDTALLAISVTANGTVFPLCFGIPLMVLMHDELGFEPLIRRR